MAEAESQPISDPRAEATDKGALLSRLDELLEQYLDTLDKYQTAREQLTAHLTAGFLSLAQANFNNQSGTRYGQDYYDERMRALRTVCLTAEGPEAAFAVSAIDKSAPRPSGSTTQASADSQRASLHPESPSAAESAASTKPSQVNNTPTSESRAFGDPLRWFGILVPPALRSAQSSFASAVEEPIPHLAALTKDLRRREVDIARLRKQIRKL